MLKHYIPEVQGIEDMTGEGGAGDDDLDDGHSGDGAGI